MISEVKEITRNGQTWYIQEIDRNDGNLESINLYSAGGDFIGEFKDIESINDYIDTRN